MMRWLRLLLLAFAALVVAAPPAWAEGESKGAAAIAPRDAPAVADVASVKLPPVPSTYVAKDVGGWLHLRYVPNAEPRVEPVVRDAAAIKSQLEDMLGEPVLGDVEVRIARDFDEMTTLAPVGLPPPSYASGVAYAPLRLVLLTLSAPDAAADAPDIEEVFRHEMVHVALEEAVAGHHVPRWFNEGVAIYASGENRLQRTKTLWDATLSRTLLPLSDLDQGFPADRFEVNIAYAESADFVRFLLRDGDEARFRSLVERTRKGTSFERALADAYGSDVRKLEYQWREELAKRYSFYPVLTGGSLLWVLTFVALVFGYVKRRRRTKATLARWAAEEAALEAAMAAAARAELAQVAAAEDSSAHVGAGPPPPRTSEVPKIEHDGGWHTVH